MTPVAKQPRIYIPELLAAWESRACFVCEKTGPCEHREPEVEMAILEAWAARRLWQENRMAGLRALGAKGFAA